MAVNVYIVTDNKLVCDVIIINECSIVVILGFLFLLFLVTSQVCNIFIFILGFKFDLDFTLVIFPLLGGWC